MAAAFHNGGGRNDRQAGFLLQFRDGQRTTVAHGGTHLVQRGLHAIGQRAGIQGAEHYVDATTLPDDYHELVSVVPNYTVFGRVSPEKKNAIIKAFQENDNIVGMVGDGVNDVLALKDADCGIAMAKGADAARQAAHIVLMDSEFSSMKNIVKEGRTIIANIERVSALYLTGH